MIRGSPTLPPPSPGLFTSLFYEFLSLVDEDGLILLLSSYVASKHEALNLSHLFSFLLFLLLDDLWASVIPIAFLPSILLSPSRAS